MTGKDKFSQGILESKKELFIKIVYGASKKFGVQQPIVKFWNCPYSKGNEIAHCHTDSFTICISEPILSDLDNDQIYETATHEVTHLIHKEHDAHFHNTHDTLKIASFKPENSGIVQISEKGLSDTTKNKFYYSPNKRKCNYLQSKEHIPKSIKECSFCKRFFCKNHLAPRPILSNFETDRTPHRFEKEINNSESHPCPPYTLVFINKIKKFKDAENKKVNDFLGKKKGREKIIYKPQLQKDTEDKLKNLKPKKQILNSKAKITHFRRFSSLKKNKTLWQRLKEFTKRLKIIS